MPPVGFEPTIIAGERPQTDALDRTATGTGIIFCRHVITGLLNCITETNPVTEGLMLGSHGLDDPIPAFT